MKTELIQHMGTDLTVVNAARVSFDKESNWDQFYFPDCNNPDIEPLLVNELNEKDAKLLSYLAKHNHWTPFSHVMITMRETVPIFVARQRFKHMVGFTYNEISRRYVDTPPEFFKPDYWRGAPENRKQGSSDKVLGKDEHEEIDARYSILLATVEKLYRDMLDMNIAPEQARMILPQSMYTSYYVTGSLAAWARAYKLRSDPHAQAEIQDLAAQWENIIGTIDELKYSWLALTNG